MDRFLFEINLKGIPVKFHLSSIFLLVSGIYYILDIPMALAAIGCSVFIIILHELGHTFFVLKYKYKLYAVVVHFLGGFCIHESCDYAHDDFWISLGGVLFQFILLILSLGVFIALSILGKMNIPFLRLVILDRFIIFNSIIIGLNLLPIRSFDGHSIYNAFKVLRNNNAKVKKRQNKKKEIKIDVAKLAEMANKEVASIIENIKQDKTTR